MDNTVSLVAVKGNVLSSQRQETDPLGLRGQELLGRYRVESTLAQGGMSVVYQGHDERLRRAVCIKVFYRLDPRDSAYRTIWEHFVQEAFALSQLKHPNTLRIYDFGYLDDEPRSPFQVSELLDGGTLAQLVRREGPLPLRTAIEILDPVIGALSEAHERGIIHRDLKPNNVLFASAGTRRIVKLVDFGIAKSLADADTPLPHQAPDTSTVAGELVNLYTPGWASPEQLRAKAIGPTSDVFSLGLLIAYLLTGKTLFSLREPDSFEEHIACDVHIAKKLDEFRLAPVIAQVIARACRYDPEERYPSVDALSAALHEVVYGDLGSGRQSVHPPASGPASAPTSQLQQHAPGTPTPSSWPTPVSTPSFTPVTPSAPVTPATPATPVLALSSPADDQVLVGGRRLRVLAVREHLDIGGEIGALRSPARLRLTLLPNLGNRARLHIKGLNCFVARAGERASSAVSIDIDADVDLFTPDRRRLDGVRCLFGEPGENGSMKFPLGAVTLAVPAHMIPAVILDLGPGRELSLLHRTREVAVDGGRR